MYTFEVWFRVAGDSCLTVGFNFKGRNKATGVLWKGCLKVNRRFLSSLKSHDAYRFLMNRILLALVASQEYLFYG